MRVVASKQLNISSAIVIDGGIFYFRYCCYYNSTMKKNISLLILLVLMIAGVGMLQLTKKPAQGVKEQQTSVDESFVVKNLVTEFGSNMKNVSLLAPADVLQKEMDENYKSYVVPELLENWKANPQEAPGRLTSSPWPERIEIDDVTLVTPLIYQVKGRVIEMTSDSTTTQAASYQVVIEVFKGNEGGTWRISTFEKQSY